MARRKTATPSGATIPGTHPRRREFAVGWVRLRGWQLLPVDRQMAWLLAWRRFADGGPCPVPPALLEAAIAAWPWTDARPLVDAWSAIARSAA